MLRLLTFCFLAMLFDGAGKSACCKQLMFFNFALICTHLPSKKKTENNPCILKMNIYDQFKPTGAQIIISPCHNDYSQSNRREIRK